MRVSRLATVARRVEIKKNAESTSLGSVAKSPAAI